MVKKKEKRRKSLPVIQMWQELRVSSLDPENPLEKEMATHSSILAGIILQRSLVGKDWDTTEQLEQQSRAFWLWWLLSP